MAFVFDTIGDIISYLQSLPRMSDETQREAEFKEYFLAYEECVRSHNDLSKVPDTEVRAKLISNLVYLSGYCDDEVQTCIEALTGKSLLEVHAENLNGLRGREQKV